jgi:hypothetical protein
MNEPTKLPESVERALRAADELVFSFPMTNSMTGEYEEGRASYGGILRAYIAHQRAAMEAMAGKIRNSGRNLCEIEGLCPHAPNSGACVHSPCPTTDDIIAWAEQQVKGERT